MSRMNELEQIITNIFQKKLEEVKKLSYESSDEWDSLKHMELIVAIEDKFDLDLSEEQMLEMTTYDKIVRLVAGSK
ncbi:acyl carrier protein [Planktomarina temperata]|nr:acyl carrier protein [Planktomarina temperata]